MIKTLIKLENTMKSVFFLSLEDMIACDIRKQKFNGFKVSTLNHENSDDVFCNIPIRIDCFAITIVTQGILRLRNNFSEYILQPGDIYLGSPSNVVEFLEVSSDIDVVCFLISVDFSKKIGVNLHGVNLLESVLTGKMSQLSVDRDVQDRLVMYIKHLGQLNSPGEAKEFHSEIVNTTLKLMTYEIGAALKLRVQNEGPIQDRQHQVAFDFINLAIERFKENKSIESYAADLFISRKYLSRVVKEVTGMTPAQIVNQLVIAEAITLLNIFNYTMTAIVDELNYVDMPTFSKFFKRHVGLSPLAYRQSIRTV